MRSLRLFLFFFFNDTATTEIYTLSLHDALPIWRGQQLPAKLLGVLDRSQPVESPVLIPRQDRKSTRLNSSHSQISYAVFCLKKKKKKTRPQAKHRQARKIANEPHK